MRFFLLIGIMAQGLVGCGALTPGDLNGGMGGSNGGACSDSSGSGGYGGGSAGLIHLTSLGDIVQGSSYWRIVFRPQAKSFENFGEVRVGCSVADAGSACTLYTCDEGTGYEVADTGTPITVTGGHQDMSFVWEGQPLNSYTTDTFNSVQVGFEGGDNVRVMAPGGVVPPIDETVVGPTPVTLTAPDISSHSITINRAADLTVSWTGGVAGDTLVVDVGTNTGAAKQRLKCLFAASAGTAIVPACALGLLPLGAAYFFVATGREKTVRDGGWKTTIQLSHEAQDGAGNRCMVPGQFQ